MLNSRAKYDLYVFNSGAVVTHVTVGVHTQSAVMKCIYIFYLNELFIIIFTHTWVRISWRGVASVALLQP